MQLTDYHAKYFAFESTKMTLVLRKLRASSTFAIAGALTSISNRPKLKLRKLEPEQSLDKELDQDYETLDETAEEWAEDEAVKPLSDNDGAALEREVADLDEFARLATFIDDNAKGKALVKVLGVAFAKAAELGAAHTVDTVDRTSRIDKYWSRP